MAHFLGFQPGTSLHWKTTRQVHCTICLFTFQRLLVHSVYLWRDGQADIWMASYMVTNQDSVLIGIGSWY